MTLDLPQLQAFRKDLLLGKIAPGGALQKLALAAMLGKFEPASRPLAGFTTPITLRSANYPDSTTRKALIRLLSGRDGNVSDRMAFAIPVVLKQHDLSLHPFDFARLEEFVAQNAEQLSQDARDWLRLTRPEYKVAEDPYQDGPITEEQLMQINKAQRVLYLRDLRASDPSRARSLIEGMMPMDAADMRLRLLRVLDHHLGSDDQLFLESLLKDRAPTVKEQAQVMLGRIPGTENHARLLARLTDVLAIKTEGLLRRRKVITYKGPDPKPGQNRFADNLGNLGLADIARAFGEDPGSLISIAMQSDKMVDLQVLLVRKAVDEGNIPLIEKAAQQLNSPDGMLMFSLIDSEFGEKPEAERTKILRLCFTPGSWQQLPQAGVLAHVAAHIPPALPDDVALELIAHPAWSKADDNAKKICFDAIAPLIPVQHSATFGRMVEAVAPRAALYHRFLSSLT